RDRLVGVSACCRCISRRAHSFPTRRSSDLAPAFAAIGIGRNRIAAAGVITASEVITAWRTLSTPGRRPSPESCAQAYSRSAMRRSEEHTSELQSRVELVWRLLLDKKKKTYQ